MSTPAATIGHPVELIVGDDGGDRARHQAMVKEFVEERQVVGFVMNAAPVGPVEC